MFDIPNSTFGILALWNFEAKMPYNVCFWNLFPMGNYLEFAYGTLVPEGLVLLGHRFGTKGSGAKIAVLELLTRLPVPEYV